MCSALFQKPVKMVLLFPQRGDNTFFLYHHNLQTCSRVAHSSFFCLFSRKILLRTTATLYIQFSHHFFFEIRFVSFKNATLYKKTFSQTWTQHILSSTYQKSGSWYNSNSVLVQESSCIRPLSRLLLSSVFHSNFMSNFGVKYIFPIYQWFSFRNLSLVAILTTKSLTLRNHTPSLCQCQLWLIGSILILFSIFCSSRQG